MNEIVKVTGLTKQFGDFTAVNNLHFTVFKGDIYGFLGQNGAGKSTTIRMLTSLIMPTSGNIEIMGMPLTTNRMHIMRQIGAVIEKPDLYKYLSAYENLKLFAGLSGTNITHQQLMAQLEQVGLANRAKDRVHTFSQGMKQRLGIAIALVHNPQLVILDEPTNGLDPQGIADIRNLIMQLSSKEGKTILVSSHLLSEIEQMATRLLIIDKGTKKVEGSISELLDPAKTTIELQTNDTANTLQILQASQWATYIQTERTQHSKVVLQMHREQIPDLHRFLAQQPEGLMQMQTRNHLEDYFLQITA